MKLADSDKLSMVTGACLIALVAILKTIVPPENLANDVIIYIILYTGFSVSAKKMKLLHGALAIILATFSIVCFYAFI